MATRVRSQFSPSQCLQTVRAAVTTKDLQNGAATNPDPKTIAGDSFLATDVNNYNTCSNIMLCGHHLQ